MDPIGILLLLLVFGAALWVVASFKRGWETSRLGRILMTTAAAGWIALMLFIGVVAVLFMYALTRMGVP